MNSGCLEDAIRGPVMVREESMGRLAVTVAIGLGVNWSSGRQHARGRDSVRYTVKLTTGPDNAAGWLVA